MDWTRLEHLTAIHILWIALFLGAWMVQLFYWFYFFLRLARYKSTSTHVPDHPVSIVICAKNEEKNLMECIPLLMEQDYKEFEVIVVNDSSRDDTEEILKALQAPHNPSTAPPNTHAQT